MMGCPERAIILAAVLLCGNVFALTLPTAGRQPATEAALSDGAKHNLDAYHSRARAAIKEVLVQREFVDLRSDPDARLRRLRDWIIGWLGRVGSAIHALPEWVLWVVVTWMVLTLAAILAHLIYTLVKLLKGTAWRPGDGAPLRRHPGELLGIRDWISTRFMPKPAGFWQPATGWPPPSISTWRRFSGWTAGDASPFGCQRPTAITSRSCGPQPRCKVCSDA